VPFVPKKRSVTSPPALCKLSRAEGHVHIVRIVEDHVVISVDIAVRGGTTLPPPVAEAFNG